MIYQKWRSTELSDFSVFIDSSLSVFSSSDPLETKVSMLNSVLLSGLDSLLLKSHALFHLYVLLVGIMTICV